jgi:hypothetical protein
MSCFTYKQTFVDFLVHDIALQIMKEANRIGINLLALHARTTHGLQSLYVSVFTHLKNYFKFERVPWMEKNPKMEVKRFELVELAKESF